MGEANLARNTWRNTWRISSLPSGMSVAEWQRFILPYHEKS